MPSTQCSALMGMPADDKGRPCGRTFNKIKNKNKNILHISLIGY